MMFQIETLHTFDTEYSADSIEWCSSLDFHDYFVCGTYQLVENQQEESSKDRKGRIYLFQYDLDEDTLQLKSSRDTNAILDQKWLKSSLITATSAGEVEHYIFEEDQLKIMANVRLSADEPEVLALSIDVNEGSKKILASDSKGNLSMIDLETMKVQENWAAHGFEAWTCAFDKWNENVVYSGKFIC